MMGVVRRSGLMKNVARAVCSAVVEPPRVAAGERGLGRAVPVREASNVTFEPGFHWRKMIQAHHMSCCANLGNPPPREVCNPVCTSWLNLVEFEGRLEEPDAFDSFEDVEREGQMEKWS
jgi:hypothetical protein